MDYYIATATFYIPRGDETYQIILKEGDEPHLRDFINSNYYSDAEDFYEKYVSGTLDDIDPEIDLEWMEEIIEESSQDGTSYHEIILKIIEWYFCSIQVEKISHGFFLTEYLKSQNVS